MPRTVAQLLALFDLEQVDQGLFRGPQPETVLQRSFGGQVLAQALAAAYRTIPDDRVAHSLHAYFLRPGTTSSPIIYLVEDTRDGGHFSSRRVVARQDGRPIFSMGCSFQAAETGLDHADQPPSHLPAPAECPPAAEVLAGRSARAAAVWAEEWGAIDVRYVVGSSGPGPNHSAHTSLWVKAESDLPDDPAVHQMVLAYLSDISLLAVATVPHRVHFLSPSVQAASIDHSMWFHRPARADRWLLYDQVSPSASSGRGFSLGRLFSGTTLAASCAQEGLIRVVEPQL